MRGSVIIAAEGGGVPLQCKDAYHEHREAGMTILLSSTTGKVGDAADTVSHVVTQASDQGPLVFVLTIALILIAAYAGARFYFIELPESREQKKTSQANQELVTWLKSNLELNGKVNAGTFEGVQALLSPKADTPHGNVQTNAYLRQLIRIAKLFAEFANAHDFSESACRGLAARIQDALVALDDVTKPHG